jgi:hypothetical protein
MSGLTCYRHRDAAAQDRCSACARTICPVCVVEIDHRTVCKGCAARAEQRRGKVKMLILACALVASAATLWFLFLRDGGGEGVVTARADAGIPAEMRAEMDAMRGRLTSDPCDAEAAWQLGGMLNAVGDYPATLALVDRTVARCGESVALYQVSIYALEKSQMWDQAVGLTTQLIAEHPQVPDYWAWRADALTGRGELEQATFDYRQSLAIRANNGVVRFAELTRRRGRPCEGVFALSRFIDDVATTRAWVHELRRDLYVEGDCATRLGTGRSSLPLARVRARVGGAIGDFLVSERMPHVVVSRAFAEKAGLRVVEEPALTAVVGEETVTIGTTSIDRIQIQEVSATGFEAAVVDKMPAIGDKPLDGVIGLDFVWRFASAWDGVRVDLRPLRIAL